MTLGRHRLGVLREFDVLIVTSLLWFLAKFVRYLFPPLFETFAATYGVSPATLGAMFTGLMLAYGAMQFPSGALADRVGQRSVVIVGALTVAVASIGLFGSQAFAVLVLAMILIGAGTGLHKTVAIDLIAAVYPDRPARMLGAMDATGEVAGVVAPVAVVAVVGIAVGWNVLFLVAGLAAAGLAVLFGAVTVPRGDRTRHRPARSDATASDPRDSSYLASFRRPSFLLFVGSIVIYAFVATGVIAFLPLFLTTVNGVSTGTAGLLYAILFAAGLVQPVTGAIADRFGRYPVLIGTLLVQAIALGALLGLPRPHPWLLVGIIAVLGLGIHGFRPVRDAHLVAIIPSAVSGGTLGLVRTITISAGAVAPAIVGALSEFTGFVFAFWALAGLAVAALVFVTGTAAATRADPG